jgi:hypothetical protein
MRRPTSRRQVASLIGRVTVEGIRHRRAFGQVECFCLLIGYPHSGSTLFSSLLNAHPEMVLAVEADSLRYVRPGLSGNQLFALILERDRQLSAVGRQWNGHDYAIGASDQGRLRVIGDKCIGGQMRRLVDDPRLLDRLRSKVRVPVRVIHLVRNPFDNIASMGRKRKVTVSTRIARYAKASDALDDIRSRLSPEELLEVRYESVVADPVQSLTDAWGFLGLKAPSVRVLSQCAQLVQPSLSRSRSRVEWSAAQCREVEEIIATRPVLGGYTFA